MPVPHRTLLSIAMLAAACVAESEPAELDLDYRCPGCNWGPPVLNTHGLNGLPVAALDITGQMYDGWRLDQVQVLNPDKGLVTLLDVHANKGTLYGTGTDGLSYHADGFVGSVWTVTLEATGDKHTLEITAFTNDPVASRYTFHDNGGPTTPKEFTCEQDPETGEHSSVLFDDLDVDPTSGHHFERPDTIYFGCLSGAVGKAALWGYSPWNTDEDTHQTASRAVRADFCGDGTSYTIVGTPLQVHDVVHVNDFVDPSLPTEAMWGPEGAQCLLSPRLGQDPSTILCGPTQKQLSACDPGHTLDDWPDALLWTKNWY